MSERVQIDSGKWFYTRCLVGWGCRIHRLFLCWWVRPPSPNESPRYDTKQFDGEVPVMLELWGMQSTLSLPLLPGPLWPGMVAPDIYGLNRTNCILMLNWIIWIRTVWLNWIAWNRNILNIKLYLHLNRRVSSWGNG